MNVLGCKEGHDGAFAILKDAKLTHYIESEKDSFPRCGSITNDLLIRAAKYMDDLPDIVAVGGWTKGLFSSDLPSFSGYFGVGDKFEVTQETEFFGKKTTVFSSSHEASHIWNAYSMSPYPQGQPCYILVWEGNVGNFYFIDEQLRIQNLGCAMTDPGNRYTFIYSMADICSPDEVGYYDTAHPGKMMALAAYGSSGEMNSEERKLWDELSAVPQFELMNKLKKSDFSNHFLYNIGVETPEFKQFARRATEAIFTVFYNYAKNVCFRSDIPLLIAGGCGLNCEWNSRWLNSGLFSDVFVPPCTNDSGSAAGTAAHAMFKFTGNAKLDWSVYCGEDFVMDTKADGNNFKQTNMDVIELSNRIQNGAVIAWVEGKYEIGPRALGHRSLIASAHCEGSLAKLNKIKNREHFRPVAPIAIHDSLDCFSPEIPSPYMLHFYDVITKRLPAITHVDNSARLQTVTKDDAPYLYALLLTTLNTEGEGVLCNTSLNYSGKGFINRKSDLISFSEIKGLDGYVIDGTVFWKTN